MLQFCFGQQITNMEAAIELKKKKLFKALIDNNNTVVIKPL